MAGSHIEYEGVQVKKAALHGLSGGRANEYTYDDRGRLATSKAAREESAPASTEVVTPADFRLQLERPPGELPSLTFAEQTGHKIATLTRGTETRTFSYGAGAERVSDGRFRYEFDARGRLIRATEEVPAGATSSLTLRRLHYDYSASGRIVGRRAEYAQLASSSTTPLETDWKLEDRAAILAADALPADTTFVFDPISDQLVAIHDATTGAPLRQLIHGGNG